MSFFLNIFSIRSWEDFRRNGSCVTGFNRRNWSRSKRINEGDIFLCYLVGVKRWVGILKITSERYLDDSEQVFRDDPYPVRFQVEPVIALDPEFGVPMAQLRGKLSFFPAEGDSKDWSGRVRTSPSRFSDEDGEAIRSAIELASQNRIGLPIDPKTLMASGKKRRSHAMTQGNQEAGNPFEIRADSSLAVSEAESQALGKRDNDSDDLPDGIDEGEVEFQSKEGVSIEKADRSLSELHRWYKSGRLIIDPEWQRSYVWDNRRASKLVESFLIDIPIPVVYLARTEDGKYEVIDGVQRLTSVFKFFENDLKLGGMEFLKDINSHVFRDLDHVFQAKLEDATVRTFELSPKTSKSLLFVIFERLNTGGIALNEMEIRNCIYRGPLNNLIKALAQHPAFIECVDQANISRRMYDRNLVLRFLAFYEKTYQKAQSGLKSFLNGFLQDYHKDPSEKKLNEWKGKFDLSMKASRTIFGQNGFRLWLPDRKGNGQWTKNVNASIFQCLSVSFADSDQSKLTRCADAVLEEYLNLVTTDSHWVDCVTKSTGDYNKIKYVFETWKSRLVTLLESVESLDPDRIFSSRLKREMFIQDKTCNECGQEIKLIQDAALDHDVHYWRGGKTIPSNARLVHRLCNLKKPK